MKILHRYCCRLIIFVAILVICVPPVRACEGLKKSPWTSKTPYAEKAAHKLGFGVMNTITGWTALFFEPYRQDHFIKGIATGICRTLTNTAGGLLHTATFPIPLDIPLPGGGVQFSTVS